MLLEEIKKTLPIMEQSLSLKEMNQFSSGKYEELICYHYGWGMWIRNELLKNSTVLYHEFCRAGILNRDDMSDLLIKLFYLYLKEK